MHSLMYRCSEQSHQLDDSQCVCTLRSKMHMHERRCSVVCSGCVFTEAVM